MRVRVWLLLATAWLASPLAYAGEKIYRWEDRAGRVHYGDAAARGPAMLAPDEVESASLPPLNRQLPPTGARGSTKPTQTRKPVVAKTGSGSASLKECLRTKEQLLRAERRSKLKGDDERESWLWRNCRGHAAALRRLAQQMM